MKKYDKKEVEDALKRHDTRVGVANAIGCSPSYVAKLIDVVFIDLKHLAKWREAKSKKYKIWNRY